MVKYIAHWTFEPKYVLDYRVQKSWMKAPSS